MPPLLPGPLEESLRAAQTVWTPLTPQEAIATHELFAAALESQRNGTIVSL